MALKDNGVLYTEKTEQKSCLLKKIRPHFSKILNPKLALVSGEGREEVGETAYVLNVRPMFATLLIQVLVELLHSSSKGECILYVSLYKTNIY